MSNGFFGTLGEELWGAVKNLLITAVVSLFLAVPTLLLWNYVAQTFFGTAGVNYGGAYGLTLLSYIFFGWGARGRGQKPNSLFTS